MVALCPCSLPRISRATTLGVPGMSEPPPLRTGRPVAGSLLRLRVGVRGQPGKPPAQPWARAVEGAPARTPRLALQVHGRRPRGSPSTGREDLPEGPGTAPRYASFPMPVPGTARTVFPGVSSRESGHVHSHQRTQPGPESRSQRCFPGSRSGRTRLQSDVPAAPARGQ